MKNSTATNFNANVTMIRKSNSKSFTIYHKIDNNRVCQVRVKAVAIRAIQSGSYRVVIN